MVLNTDCRMIECSVMPYTLYLLYKRVLQNLRHYQYHRQLIIQMIYIHAFFDVCFITQFYRNYASIMKMDIKTVKSTKTSEDYTGHYLQYFVCIE